MVKNRIEYFGSPGLRGVLPFLNHLLWRGYRGRGVAWSEVWSHLLLMENELVILNAVGPPSSILLIPQQEEARSFGGSRDDVWAVVPYDEIRRVSLHARGLRAHMPRLIIDAHHVRTSFWSMDDRNHMWFDFSNLRHDPYDDAKVAYARTMLPSVFPKGTKLVGF